MQGFFSAINYTEHEMRFRTSLCSWKLVFNHCIGDTETLPCTFGPLPQVWNFPPFTQSALTPCFTSAYRGLRSHSNSLRWFYKISSVALQYIFCGSTKYLRWLYKISSVALQNIFGGSTKYLRWLYKISSVALQNIFGGSTKYLHSDIMSAAAFQN